MSNRAKGRTKDAQTTSKSRTKDVEATSNHVVRVSRYSVVKERRRLSNDGKPRRQRRQGLHQLIRRPREKVRHFFFP